MSTNFGGTNAVDLTDVRRVYGKRRPVVALDGVSVGFARGTFTAVMGPSGSGKSTLLHLAAGLDRPTAGTVTIGDTDIGGMRDKELTVLRRDRIGFVFQAFNLLPSLTAGQNVTLPLKLAGRRIGKVEVEAALSAVGLQGRARHRPSELSGGQQQRVAIARALVTRPEVLFADEPTGALDTRSAAEILTMLRRAVTEAGQTLVMVTHDPVAAAYADRVVFLADGRIAGELWAPTVEQVADQMIHLGAWDNEQDRAAVRPMGAAR